MEKKYLYKTSSNEEYAEFVSFNQGKIFMEDYEKIWFEDCQEKTLDELKNEKIFEINSIYEQKATFVKIDTPESEVLTWDIQKNEVEGYGKDSSFPTPFIDTLASSRKVEKADLIEKILAKVIAFNSYMAQITGRRQLYEDKIKAASAKSDIDTIVWE